MADYITNTNELTSIANAIRTKGGTSENLTYPGGFIQAISDIVTGGGESEGEWEDISDDFICTPMWNPGERYPITVVSNGTYGVLFLEAPQEDIVIISPYVLEGFLPIPIEEPYEDNKYAPLFEIGYTSSQYWGTPDPFLLSLSEYYGMNYEQGDQGWGVSNHYNPDPLMCMSVFKMPTSGE